MRLPSGIPTIAAVDALVADPAYAEIAAFNAAFLARHQAALAGYGRHWGRDPMGLWSRRWEYPFAIGRLLAFAAERGSPIQALDAGSGVTFFPYYVAARTPAQFICCDYDASYAPMFERVNAASDPPPSVRFMTAPLQALPLAGASLDAVCCISVLEHTSDHAAIVREFARALRPGGRLILSFDLSLDGKFTLRRDAAEALLGCVLERFAASEGEDLLRALDRMGDADILSTDHVRRTAPRLLPWSTAARVVKSVQDLATGRGFTGGFRSRTVFCCDLTRR